MSKRLTTEGYARLDIERLARDFSACARVAGLAPTTVEQDIGVALGTVTRLRRGRSNPKHGRDLSGTTLALICRWMRRNPCEYLVYDDEP